MLTAGLLAASSNNKSLGAEVARFPPASPPPPPPPPPPESAVQQPGVGAATVAAAGLKRKFGELAREPGEEGPGSIPLARDLASASASASGSVTPQAAGEVANDLKPDIVDRGLMTMELAERLFARYTTEMCQHLPGVVLPPGMTASELRASKPILFLALMTAASSEMSRLQRALNNEIMQVFADRVIVRGQKSLELVQAILVSVIWYWPPERFEELKFYQLVHIAAVMAVDIGLGRRKPARGCIKKHLSGVWRPQLSVQTDPTSLEARRTWLTCYFLTTNTAMALHRPNLIRWNHFTSECVEVLQSSPDAAPTDKYLCHLVGAHRLAEDIGVQFVMDEPTSAPNLAEPKTQYTLRGFERELERHYNLVPKELLQPSLKMSFQVISLYMHEIATYGENADGSRPQPGENPLGSETPISSAHINALSACLTAIDGIFGVFLSLDVNTVRCLPVFNLVRVAYAVVILIKIYFAASSPKSELGKIIDKDQMKVEHYIDRLLDKFRATAAEDRSRPAAKFLVVLVMMRSWFQKQKQQTQNGGPNAAANAPAAKTPPTPYPPRPSVGERPGATTPAPQRAPPQGYTTTASTPLQLLSEVATNNSAAAAAAAATGPRASTTADLLPLQTSSSSLPAPGSWLNGQLMYGTVPGPRSANAADTINGNNTNTGLANDNGDNNTNNNNNNNNNNDNTDNTITAAPFLAAMPPADSPFSGLPSVSLGTDLVYDYATTFGDGDGWAQAMNMTLVGFPDSAGFFGLGDLDMASYMMQDPTTGPPPPPPPPPQQQQQQQQHQ
ncbi:uncharacterized protein P884DRAFT_226915, partial [Thermothelomyces heterothallicus CBS 202.75]|uniref:uncharacterized protein n=1 Tax=Thermothelomyces heterothallicus CBS 202.75 TaxID=1149848 RepID=UPI003742A2E0